MAATIVAVTMASSCLVGPKLQDPELDVEAQYRFDSLLVDTIGDILWWEIFPGHQSL